MFLGIAADFDPEQLLVHLLTDMVTQEGGNEGRETGMETMNNCSLNRLDKMSVHMCIGVPTIYVLAGNYL